MGRFSAISEVSPSPWVPSLSPSPLHLQVHSIRPAFLSGPNQQSNALWRGFLRLKPRIQTPAQGPVRWTQQKHFSTSLY